MLTLTQRITRLVVMLLFACSLGLSSGCFLGDKWPPTLKMVPDEGFEDGTAVWTDDLRPKTEQGVLGTSEKSREVERNLGVR